MAPQIRYFVDEQQVDRAEFAQADQGQEIRVGGQYGSSFSVERHGPTWWITEPCTVAVSSLELVESRAVHEYRQESRRSRGMATEPWSGR